MSTDERFPNDYRYHEQHDWAIADGEVVVCGITHHAQDSLGDVVFFDPPQIGSTITSGASYGELESVKAVSDLISPVTGEVVEVNSAVVDAPESINSDPYGSWLIKVRAGDADAQLAALMDAKQYRLHVEAL